MKKVHLTGVFALLVAGCSGGVSSPLPSLPPTDPDQRADLLLAQMTQDEEIQLVGIWPRNPTASTHGSFDPLNDIRLVAQCDVDRIHYE
jgi:hypothetical protein